MSEVKNAVVVGKVTLPVKREVVMTKSQPKVQQPRGDQRPGDRAPRPKSMRRADDNRESQASNQAMLQELQYVKKQLREAQETAKRVVTEMTLFKADVKVVVKAMGTLAMPSNLLEDSGFVQACENVAKAVGL